MRDTRSSAIGISLLAGAAFVFVLTAGVDAQRRRGNDNSAFGAPVATNTIVDAPDQYFGKLVTITAGVERMVSKTTFLMDQQKVAGPKEVKAVGKPILVIAPYLTSSLDQKKYFLVRGQVVKLEPSALARGGAGLCAGSARGRRREVHGTAGARRVVGAQFDIRRARQKADSTADARPMSR